MGAQFTKIASSDDHISDNSFLSGGGNKPEQVVSLTEGATISIGRSIHSYLVASGEAKPEGRVKDIPEAVKGQKREDSPKGQIEGAYSNEGEKTRGDNGTNDEGKESPPVISVLIHGKGKVGRKDPIVV